ncbi:TolC family protein [Pedobacter antarcticus]|uniref:TolC family protein n=1 Tax=Pedobacter antarcticus TaxID=34086 RepID=UPI001C5A162E|nr:TolC family protein [Pedobacter antarcticus]
MISNLVKIYTLCAGLLLQGASLRAGTPIETDTLRLTLPQAEKQFLESNLQLISQHYQTDQARTDIITARLFDNPEFSFENQLYNPQTKRFFETSKANGQYQASISQLIKLAGKRNKNIQLAQTGVKLAEYEYFDLLRTLRYKLRTDFYKIYYDQQSARLYARQIASLEQLTNVSEQQLKSGNVAVKDVIRIKSLLYSLQSEYNALQNGIADTESEFKIMTGINAETAVELVLDPASEKTYQPQQTVYTHLLDSAMVNRADLKLSQAGISYAEQNLRVQKANAVPDVAVSLVYDLKSSYPDNYTGLGVHIPLPLFNRNQGEIKKAKIAIDAGKNQLKQQQLTLENEVFNSYSAALRTEKLYAGIDKSFSTDFDKLITEVIKNFKNRNLSLLEFMDFYESYKAATLQMNTLKYQRMDDKEEINYVTGSQIFN